VNARTDVFLQQAGEDERERIAMAVDRANAYLEAGADCVFVPGAVTVDTIGPWYRPSAAQSASTHSRAFQASRDSSGWAWPTSASGAAPTRPVWRCSKRSRKASSATEASHQC
jgi:Phosphoenolpyruvate phosphomutase